MLRGWLETGIVGAMLCCVLFASGCGDFCNPLDSTKVTVMLQGDARPVPPMAVTLDGEVIGQVKDVSREQGSRPVLTLCMQSKAAEKLNKLTVFYLDSGNGHVSLACVLASADQADGGQAAEKPENMLFLGFSSYDDYLAWKASSIVKKGVSGFLNALDKALSGEKQ